MVELFGGMLRIFFLDFVLSFIHVNPLWTCVKPALNFVWRRICWYPLYVNQSSAAWPARIHIYAPSSETFSRNLLCRVPISTSGATVDRLEEVLELTTVKLWNSVIPAIWSHAEKKNKRNSNNLSGRHFQHSTGTATRQTSTTLIQKQVSSYYLRSN